LGTGSNLPYFKTPTTTIGNTTDGSTELSNWTLKTGSYLIGKGIVTSRLKDKAGVAFAATRAIGAYEYVSSGTTELESIGDIKTIFYTSNGKLVSTADCKAEVINFSGVVLWNGKLTIGQEIVLRSGAYIIHSTTEKGTFVQKIVL